MTQEQNGQLSALSSLADAVRRQLALPRPPRPLVVGLCGAQGSGKSTLAAALVRALNEAGIPAATLSLDDLYLTHAERRSLAATVHPLLGTRGVPGTHDLQLGLDTLDAVARGEQAPLPRFDKGEDDRTPRGTWSTAPLATQALVLEGWCVGALPQPPTALSAPVNVLERDEDPDGRWRRYVNDQLAGPYRALFERIDLLVLLAAPGFDIVARWRGEQEEPLRREGRGMNNAEIARFVMHYERLTRHILAEMPARADLVLRLDDQRKVLEVRQRGERLGEQNS
ncbi:kinase [Novosphingobium sp. KCTC 2891]|uniref:kinase n=1 Tax=Novosphingobium sp. KCTC 2891 TaxID=2989730 RepID=UPI0022233406|nr:kinase [Novosphingobium sp. KCTC 2891]MCW1381319.1 kinase [Novosphingobium sp. KCTC 2891]